MWAGAAGLKVWPMIEQKDMTQRARLLQRLLQEKLGVQGKSLGHALRRAGRRLPRAMRRQAAVLQRAEAMAAHPRLARQVDRRDVDAAYRALSAHLKAIDVAAARRDRLLSLAAAIAFNILVIAVGFVVWLWWRGYV